MKEAEVPPDLLGTTNGELCFRSGAKYSSDPLVSLFYELLRDHLLPGAMEQAVQNVMNEPDSVMFCNGYLAEYAEDCAKRIRQIDWNPGDKRKMVRETMKSAMNEESEAF